ncbi:MAG: hypothetical protein NTZ90_12505 [Proteobacteria bacterium]|nr:hypothetical protein [Pseudomonadota bacterium]
MLWSRWLKSEEDLLAFQVEFKQRAGNALDLDYLRASKVRGYFTSKGEMLAGFVMRTEGPLRYYGWLSAEDRKPRLGDRVKPEDFVEITCIWMKKGRIHPFERGQIYFESIALAALSGKRALLGGSFVEKVKDLQMLVMSFPYRKVDVESDGERRTLWLYFGLRELVMPLYIKHMIIYAFQAGGRHHRNVRGRFRHVFLPSAPAQTTEKK